MTTAATFCLIGCGSAFDTIAAEPRAYHPNATWSFRPVANVAEIAPSARALLAGLDSSDAQIFVAVDGQALNFARVELYGPARLMGLKIATLVHPRAWVAPNVRMGDNVWIGPGTHVGPGCRIDNDVLVHAGARLDDHVHIAPHGWIGTGASLGAKVEVGTHSVIGSDVHVRGGVRIGRHCCLDHAGPWSRDLPDGALVEPELALPAQIIGAGYSFQKR